MTEYKLVLKSCLNGRCDWFGARPCLDDDCDWLSICQLQSFSRRIPAEELIMSVILPNNLECNCMIELKKFTKVKRDLDLQKIPLL